MASLAPADIVSIWELGSRRPDWNKALIVLAPALPEARPSELAALTIGERNAHLLALRRNLIGPVMQAMVRCPICSQPLEFEQRIDELLEGYAPPMQREFAFSSGDFSARYRLLTSDDLARAASRGDEPHARQSLIDCALLETSFEGEPVAVSDLPADLLNLLDKEMSVSDPLAHVEIPLACAACKHVWGATLEIVSFFWVELERKAKQILEDVVTLARSYGWSESAILAMDPARRQYYLEAIG
jgi:hypothetical protein